MKRVLVTGINGQVGYELYQLLKAQDLEVTGVSRDNCDLANPDQIRATVQAVQPELIVNAAAYTAVDQAESEVDLATAVNSTAPGILATAAKALGAPLIHISTDYVFDGQQNTPYTEEDIPNPVGVYGKTKLAGEQAVQANCEQFLILRTAWVYGTFGKGNFVKTMLRFGKERKELRVVFDQVGSPTWAYDLASAIAHLLILPQIPTGLYHYTNSGVTSWYDFAIAIFEEAQFLGFPLAIEDVVPITTDQYPTPVTRPPYSVLNCQKISALFPTYPPHWRHSLRKMILQLHNETH
jgi:dTDP-4-dehydrorhamnose reductase